LACQSGVAVPEADNNVKHMVTANAGKSTTSHSSFHLSTSSRVSRITIGLQLSRLQVELAQVPGFGGKLRLCCRYVRIIGQELLGTVLLAPYGKNPNFIK
jgi:hypothetical protein